MEINVQKVSNNIVHDIEKVNLEIRYFDTGNKEQGRIIPTFIEVTKKTKNTIIGRINFFIFFNKPLNNKYEYSSFSSIFIFINNKMQFHVYNYQLKREIMKFEEFRMHKERIIDKTVCSDYALRTICGSGSLPKESFDENGVLPADVVDAYDDFYNTYGENDKSYKVKPNTEKDIINADGDDDGDFEYDGEDFYETGSAHDTSWNNDFSNAEDNSPYDIFINDEGDWEEF